MSDLDNKTMLEQPGLEEPVLEERLLEGSELEEAELHEPGLDEPALDAPAPEQPRHWLDARLAPVLVATTVILGSAAVGYLGSRIWPLADFSSSKSQVASASKSNAFEPNIVLPAVAAEETKSAKLLAWIATHPLEPSQLSAPATLADKPQSEAKSEPKQSEPTKSQAESEPSHPVGSTAGGSFTVLNAGAAERATDDSQTASKTETHPSKKEQRAAARREAASKKKAARLARNQNAPSAAPAYAKSASAAAGLQDPALREFMTTPKRF